MRFQLEQIESRLQAIIESSMQILPGGHHQKRLAKLLTEAVNNSLLLAESGSLVSGGVFSIYLHPDSITAWQSVPDVCTHLSKALQETLLEAGIELPFIPTIRFVPDHTLTLDMLRIQTEQNETNSETAVLSIKKPPVQEQNNSHRTHNAFLIIDGTRILPLKQAVLNIGRRSDNHIVIEDARVSRAHAQLRSIRGKYILFDLNSTGGTFVNGQRITQITLKAGDLISLGGVPLVYGEDTIHQNNEKASDTANMLKPVIKKDPISE
jgi:hypothetical protein